LDQLPTFKDWIKTLESIHDLRESNDFPSRLWKNEVSEMTENDIDMFIQFCEDNYAPLIKPPGALSSSSCVDVDDL
jgi:hypothetical protein